MTQAAAPPTLPDLLRPGLDVVFVGINPSVYSAARGHYFARPQNRFWPAFSRSILSLSARRALGVERLKPEHDRALLDHGFGFTDVVKRPTPGASGLAAGELAKGVAALTRKLETHRPRIACFHGLTGYRPVHRQLAASVAKPALGLQDAALGRTRLFVIPNPSGANAHTTPADLTLWYDRLFEALKR
jgi:TDG/mug DNA glycosylase family protein